MLEIVQAALHTVQKRVAQLLDQLWFVAHRRSESRIDCTGIISHVVFLPGSA